MSRISASERVRDADVVDALRGMIVLIVGSSSSPGGSRALCISPPPALGRGADRFDVTMIHQNASDPAGVSLAAEKILPTRVGREVTG
jgi:hypothetical protein